MNKFISIKTINLKVSILILLSISAVALHAQDAPVVAPTVTASSSEAEKVQLEKNWEGTVGFSAVLNTGNASNQTLGGNGLVSYKKDSNKVTFAANGAYGRAEVNGATETNTKNWLTNLRYDRFLSDVFTVFGYGFWGQNEPAGFDDRFGGGTGIAHDFYKTEEDTLRYELGYDYTRELRVTPPDASIHSARTFFKYTRKIADWVNFNQDIEALWNLQSGEDVRLNTLSSLTTKLTNSLAFQVGVGVRFDNDPVPGFKKTDTQTQAGLVVNFL